MPEDKQKLISDAEFRTELNKFLALIMRWKRTSGYNDARSAGLRGFSEELRKILMTEMVDEEGDSLWTPAECIMVLVGTIALVAYGDMFPEKQKSLLGTLKREKSIDEPK